LIRSAGEWIATDLVCRKPEPQPAPGGFASDLRGASRAIALAIAAVIVLQPLFVIALVAARHLANVDTIATTIRSAFTAGVLADDQVPVAWINRGGHQFTECVALNVALDAQDDLLKSALLPKLHFQIRSSCAELHQLVAGDNTNDTIDYSRYWHGYRIYLWPLLAHLDLQQVRCVNAFLVLVAAAVFLIGLRSAIGVTPAAIFCLVFFGLTDVWRIWVITTHALGMELILAGAGIFALVFRRMRSPGVAVVLAAVLGSLFNFVDFLVNPPLMPMLLGFIVMAVAGANAGSPRRRRADPMAALSASVLTAASWFGGYGLTWGSKWMLATWLSNNPGRTVADIVNQIAFRLNGLEEGSRMFRVPLVPTLEMILTSFDRDHPGGGDRDTNRVARQGSSIGISQGPLLPADITDPDQLRLVRAVEQPHAAASAFRLSQRGRRDRHRADRCGDGDRRAVLAGLGPDHAPRAPAAAAVAGTRNRASGALRRAGQIPSERRCDTHQRHRTPAPSRCGARRRLRETRDRRPQHLNA
jgi:hypothetical protein